MLDPWFLAITFVAFVYVLTIDLNQGLVLLITSRHGPRRKHRFSVACHFSARVCWRGPLLFYPIIALRTAQKTPSMFCLRAAA
jgi:hypothetical protein